MGVLDFPYVYRWRTMLRGAYPARFFGQRCRVIARGSLNSALVEFESGGR